MDKIDYIYLLFVCCLWFGWFVVLRDLYCVCDRYIFTDCLHVVGTAEGTKYYILYQEYFV